MINNIFVKAYFNYSGYFFRRFPKFLSLFLPRTLIVEASNMCMLKCPACATINSSKRQKGVMSFETFKYILDGLNWKVKRINFSYAGEPLVNPQISRMVRYAKDKGIDSIIETNGMLLEEQIDELIDCGVSKINIAFDGTDQASASEYRRGINFDAVLSGVRHLTQEKNKRRLAYPKIHLQFIVMKHNENSINEAIKLAGDLGVDYIDFKSMVLSSGSGLTKEDKKQLASQFLPTKEDFLRYEFINGEWRIKKGLRKFCTHVLSDTVIMWNGDVTVCTMDVDGNFIVGNVYKTALSKIWSGKAYSDLRRKILGKELDVCKECGYLVSDFKSVKVN